MNRLLRLYPAVWRHRYGDEFEAILAERPPDLRERLDIVRGALDARLRPQQSRAGEGSARPGWGPWVVACAVLGGLLFVLASSSLAIQDEPIPWSRDARLTLYAAWLGALLLAVGPLRAISTAAGSSPVARRLFPFAAISAFIIIGWWPIFVLGFYLFTVACLATAIVLARTEGSVWLLVVGGSLANFVFNTGGQQAWLLVPFGLAWVIIGLLHAGGRPVGAEPPHRRTQPEAILP